MRETQISLPELALVGGTRAVLGAGVGLLLANRLNEEQRRAAGWALVLIGALSTIPLAFEVLGGKRMTAPMEGPEQGGSRTRVEANEPLAQRYASAQN
jgi:hypothetical protein